jgi:hypothetical protein
MDKENYVAAMNELFMELGPVLGAENLTSILKSFQEGGTFPQVLHIDHQGVRDIKIDPEKALALLTKSIYEKAPPQADLVEMAILKVLWGRQIPVPVRQ